MRTAEGFSQTSRRIINILLGEEPLSVAGICEASVHLPRRGRIWQASFTGPNGGQVWKSTGLINREQALLVARRWEKDARIQRERLGLMPRLPFLRVRHSGSGNQGELLTQREVALLLGISERAV